MEPNTVSQTAVSQTPSTWVSPGVSVHKRWMTAVGVALAATIFFLIALKEGGSMLVSTLIGVVFIGAFVWYLRVVAPTPFTLALDDHGVTRTERGGEPATIAWDGVAKIKEEVFKSGKSVSVTVYKRVGARGLHRSWVAYRDDLPDFDGLLAAMRDRLPESVPWLRETVHE